MTEPTSVSITVEVPADLAPRVYAAIRSVYGALTAEIPDDNEAAEAVVAYWLQDTLATGESRAAGLPVIDEVAAVEEKFRKAADRAREKAMRDAEAISRKANKAAEKKVPK
ncbi:hypothetical protein [Geodermatophilus sp. DSM 45219]|uniref:hypothetical protein n=1 Tax=Geodermatophilus sp. DSM 45219 TaxID=1881103 RepID=UPI00087E5609|nr:hypothetical protein [Geodermatophilus sp. DSM 45219]SDN78889.1 hypothetical protein SAMN05428965_1630 [Geodermatophilus sp. DSM 45219]